MRKLFEYYKIHFKIIIYIVVFIVCFGLAMLLLSPGKGSSLMLPFGNKMAPQTMVPTSNASMTIMTPAGTSNFAVGQDIELTIQGNSNNTSVTGYDVLFSFDPAMLSVVRVSSVNPSFDAFTYNHPNYVSVTGTKKLSINADTPFVNSPILSIVVRAKSPGMTSVMITLQLGPEKTKMVDNKAQIIIPQLGEAVQLNVQ